MQTLYEVDSTGHLVEEVLLRNLDEPFSDSGNAITSLDEAGQAYASMLVEGVLAHRGEMDELIARSAPNWPVEQMSNIDRNILRLAIFEILFDNRVPLKASINEAVELAKRFGSDSSSRFINGVLGTVAAGGGARKPGRFVKGSKAIQADGVSEDADTDSDSGDATISDNEIEG